MDIVDIDTVLFDLGGVVLNIDPQRTINAFGRLGLADLQNQISHGHHNGLFKAFEQGSLSEIDFIAAIGKEVPNACEKDIVEAWCAMLLDIPEKRVQIIEALKEKFQVYLLSNTNSMHKSHFDGAANGYKCLSDLFHRVYYSYELKLSKPDKAAFEKVVEHSKLVPAKTLFLDDSAANIEVAQSMGFKTALITSEYTMEMVFGDMF